MRSTSVAHLSIRITYRARINDIYDIFKYKNAHGEIPNIFRARDIFVCVTWKVVKNGIDKFQR